MSGERGALMRYELAADRVTLEVLAERSGVHPERILYYVEYGLLEPAERREDRLYFEVAAVLRVRRIERLRRDLGVNLAGISIILDLRDRVLRLQGELKRREE